MGKTKIVRQLRNGQITIPKEFRDAMHLQPDDLLAVTLEDGKLELTGVKARPATGSPWLKELYDLFAPARQRIIESGMTSDEINAEIDAAIEEVRREGR
jgi:AbrB family looped-hinge helix DNA binding protein